jgi:hypothetical protein
VSTGYTGGIMNNAAVLGIAVALSLLQVDPAWVAKLSSRATNIFVATKDVKALQAPRRQKRHEGTVHEKHKHEQQYCWVSGCTTGPFPRSDSLKAHLKKTHGEKKANQRNKYVATLDENGKYYDPDWRGEPHGRWLSHDEES